jgi:DNA-binding transcriptional ArsR family regulator
MIFEMRGRFLDASHAVTALAALAHAHRLALFRLLVEAGAEGLAAGAIAERLGLPNSSSSFHLAQLRGAGLVTQERRHRSLVYRADYAAMDALVGYLMANCCGGSACAPGPACGDVRPEAERQTA